MIDCNPFMDQALLMHAYGQTVGTDDPVQSEMYADLIVEEFGEWTASEPASVDDLDAVIDMIVVLIGYAHSRGWDISGAWGEVMRSNFAKVDLDGRVRRREDGKVIKPPGWTPPNLRPYLKGPK